MALSTRTKYVSGLISLKDTYFTWEDIPRLFDLLSRYLDENADEYGFILHHLDVTEDGSYKTPHIHFAAIMQSPKRLSTYLREICDFCELGDFAVTLKRMVSFEGSLQYLIHKNNPEKAQYPVDFIHTNIERETLLSYLDDVTAIDYESLRSVILESNTKCDVMSAIGLSMYRAYRPVISDLWDILKRPHHVDSDGVVDMNRKGYRK